MKNIIIKTVLSAVVLAVGLGAGYWSFVAGIWRFNYPPRGPSMVHGLDVSHHQNDIRWHEIPKDEYAFVYIKATEGGDWRDRKFEENWNAARTQGFKAGAYHFFTLCRPAADQAENFIATVPVEPDALPPAIDVEFGGNCGKRPTKAEFAAELEVFIAQVQAHYEQKPVIYATAEFHAAYLAGTRFTEYPLWIRNIWTAPDETLYPGWHIWQYANYARVKGIDGPVDLNVMR
ncbi:MAG: glycoside hydrolase family 25 protein [Alphaproteobacteria bacterium]|nr:glycoside hydrolase family 25 protein [Alphaproteobacteria bacterium]